MYRELRNMRSIFNMKPTISVLLMPTMFIFSASRNERVWELSLVCLSECAGSKLRKEIPKNLLTVNHPPQLTALVSHCHVPNSHPALQQGRLWLFHFSFGICFYDLVVPLFVIDRMFISPPKSICCNPNSQSIWRWTFRELVRFK